MKLYLADNTLVNVSDVNESCHLREEVENIQLAIEISDDKDIYELATIFTPENISVMNLEYDEGKVIVYHKSVVDNISIRVSEIDRLIHRTVRLS